MRTTLIVVSSVLVIGLLTWLYLRSRKSKGVMQQGDNFVGLRDGDKCMYEETFYPCGIPGCNNQTRIVESIMNNGKCVEKISPNIPSVNVRGINNTNESSRIIALTSHGDPKTKLSNSSSVPIKRPFVMAPFPRL